VDIQRIWGNAYLPYWQVHNTALHHFETGSYTTEPPLFFVEHCEFECVILHSKSGERDLLHCGGIFVTGEKYAASITITPEAAH
jgi:hypothetical protein